MGLPMLKDDPSPILPILEKLKRDESESVRRSVANNLNDISKDNPELVIALLKSWQVDKSDEIQAITGHALRTLVKLGDAAALELLGFSSKPEIALHNLVVKPKSIRIGEGVTISFVIESLSKHHQQLMIDYAVYHMRANGQQTAKVFKLAKKLLLPGERIKINKTHSFKPITTRKYYPGEHTIEPKVNGRAFKRAVFYLEE
jgi:3-methyladenine DNA glycosylase AlkD